MLDREDSQLRAPPQHLSAGVDASLARFFHHLTQFRCIATRHAKLQQTFLALVQLAAPWIMLQSIVNRP